MADTKLSALTALTGANTAPDDLLYISDTSVTTSKSITRQELQTYNAGTLTTDVKVQDYSATWNAAGVTFTGKKTNITNTASAAGSLIEDWQVGGTSKFALSNNANFGLILADGMITSAKASGDLSINAQNISGRASHFFSYIGVINAVSIGHFGWCASSTLAGATSDTAIDRPSANSVRFGTGVYGSETLTSRTCINKAVASIADNTATATFTVTIPNAAHSASIRVRLTGSLGAGGAIGANESTQDAEYHINVTRTAGVNAVATIGAVTTQAAAASVAGAANAATTGTLSAISGAVGATNTFTINVTIARSGGSSANHTAMCFAELLNANATGITIA